MLVHPRILSHVLARPIFPSGFIVGLTTVRRSRFLIMEFGNKRPRTAPHPRQTLLSLVVKGSWTVSEGRMRVTVIALLLIGLVQPSSGFVAPGNILHAGKPLLRARCDSPHEQIRPSRTDMKVTSISQDAVSLPWPDKAPSHPVPRLRGGWRLRVLPGLRHCGCPRT